jgi:predicted HicB family RNase H-like nuclease
MSLVRQRYLPNCGETGIIIESVKSTPVKWEFRIEKRLYYIVYFRADLQKVSVNVVIRQRVNALA